MYKTNNKIIKVNVLNMFIVNNIDTKKSRNHIVLVLLLITKDIEDIDPLFLLCSLSKKLSTQFRLFHIQ